ncbi:hypothetical protein K435DRAFT_853674 [Dendrothele bispora CBS 962.96]|uniref:Uncharacterized protein n=1 Tax=Dendrothele bispora (strain CBS 962.96) TaxID=1314807 RepID=A0A4S8MH12_DENBC|nr:hypothetical protein K435DRAFT_853674 [Dendrothele bispora CBS 962.96]
MNHASSFSNRVNVTSPMEVRESPGSPGAHLDYPISSSGSEPTISSGVDGRECGSAYALAELQKTVAEYRRREELAVGRLNIATGQLAQLNAEKSVLLRRLSDVSFLGIRMIQGNPMPAFGRIYQLIDEAILGVYESTARVRSNEGGRVLTALETIVARLDGCFSMLRRFEVVSRMFVGGGADRERLIRVLMNNLPSQMSVPSFNTVLERTRLPFPNPRPPRAPILPPAPPNSPNQPSLPTNVRFEGIQATPPNAMPVRAGQSTTGDDNSHKRALEDLEEGELPSKRSK